MARRTKDLIYQGALEVFSQRGFRETTMEAIAEKAGVAKGTLYYNFKTKEELFIYVMRRGLNHLTERLRAALQAEEDPAKKWRHVIESQFRFFEENRAFCHLLVQKIWSTDVHGQVSLQDLLGEYFLLLDKEWIAAQQRGWIDPDLDVQALSGAFFGMIMVPAARAVLRGGRIDDEKRVHTIVQMMLRQLRGADGHETSTVVD